jgi:hypothetical protein
LDERPDESRVAARIGTHTDSVRSGSRRRYPLIVFKSKGRRARRDYVDCEKQVDSIWTRELKEIVYGRVLIFRALKEAGNMPA